jgi:DNA polymerase-3 subunit gamma/tau
VTTALYRRYRPETFAEVVGQDHVTAPLRQALRTGQVNHAYLFSGPRGCGKTTSARILARCLNCAEGPTDTPCGVCASCVELARGGPGSLDVVEIDAASHGGVDDARDLRERATFAPARDRYKIFILDEAHMVSPQGFNALLKIVEEPPPHIKFIFATTEPDKVIGTIRSRTHHYPFRLIPPDVMVGYLEQLCGSEGITVGAGVLPLVVRAGAGSARDSLSVLDQLVAGSGPEGLDYEGAVALLGYTHASLLDDLVDAIAARDGASAFRVVERVISTGHEPRRFVEDLLERLRDLIVIAASGDAAGAALRDLPADQLTRMRGQAAHLGAAELSRSADLSNAALSEMTGATSPRLHLELLMARLLLPAVDDSVSGLGARLDRLERGLPAGSAGTGSAAAPAPVVGVAPPPVVASRPTSPVVAPPPIVAPAPVAAAVTPPVVVAPSPVVASAPAPAPAAPPVPATPSAADVAWPEPSLTVPAREPAREPAGAPTTPDDVAQPVPVPAVDRPAPQPAARPTSVEPPAVAAPAPAAAGAGQDTEMLRRRWPEVLETLNRLKKATWVLVSQNAQVAELDATLLRLAFTAPGIATAFRGGQHAEMVQRAVRETLGFDVRVEPVLHEPGAPAGGAGGAQAAGRGGPAASGGDERGGAPGSMTMSAAQAAASWDAPARPAAATPSAGPAGAGARAGGHPGGPGAPGAGAEPGAATGAHPDDPGAPWPEHDPGEGDPYAGASIPPGEDPYSDVPPPGAPRGARGGGQSSALTSAEPPVTARVAAERAYAASRGAAASTPVEDDPSPDDPDLASTGLSGAPLVAQLLGGTVIDEQLDDPR